MPTFPKLKVTHLIDGQPSEEILEFEQAPYFVFNYDVIVIVEGKVIKSYEELIRIASQDRYRDQDFIELHKETLIPGG